MSKISILVSDVATASEMEIEIKSKGKEIERLYKSVDNLNLELEEWKKQYKNLEKEKERLFLEMKSEKEIKISSLVNENEEIKKYVRKLEKEGEGSITAGIKNMADLSKRQQNRRLHGLGTRAQKALWFGKHFGLEIDRLEFLDNKGQKYGLIHLTVQKPHYRFFKHHHLQPAVNHRYHLTIVPPHIHH